MTMDFLAGRLTRAMKADMADNATRSASLAGEQFSQSAVGEYRLHDCVEYGAGSCRNSDMIDGLTARAEAAETEVARLEGIISAARLALGGYCNSDLVSLATTLNARNEALEVANENMREALEHIAGFALHPDLADALKTMAFIASAVLAEQDEDNDE